MDLFYKDLPLDSDRDYLITDLINVADRDFKYFEKAVAPAIDEMYRKLEFQETEAKNFIDKNFRDEDGNIIPYHLSELGHHYTDRRHLENQLLSLIEMKVVYFFKSLENSIKDLMKLAYPDHYVPETYKFHNVSKFFDFKGIKLSELKGYKEFDKIRIQNNSIKHRTSPDSDFLITIDGHNSYTYETLENVYNENKDGAVLFIDSLKDIICDDLFMYSDERIKTIADGLAFKMRKEPLDKLIIELQKLSEHHV